MCEVADRRVGTNASTHNTTNDGADRKKMKLEKGEATTIDQKVGQACKSTDERERESTNSQNASI